VVVSQRFDLPAIGPATAIAFPRPAVHELPNGLMVQAIPWPAVPVVAVALVLPEGAAADPVDRPGLTGLVADMLDEGAGSRDAIALADAFARLGARFDIEVGADSTTIGLTTLARHTTASLALLADIVFRPHLEQDALDRVRDLRLSRLKQLSRTPAAPADRAFLKAIFGNGPYGHGVLGTTAVLQAVSRDDVRQRWSQTWRPQRATLILAGDVDAARAGEMAMTAGLGAAIDVPDVASPVRSDARPAGVGPVTWLVDRPDAPQSEVRIGHLGPARKSSDYHALVTLNALLGGQFTSRINRNLRETRGITYGARSAFDFRRSVGTFECGASVQADATALAVSEIRRELAEVRQDRAITPDEIGWAKASLTRGYARGFETARQLVRAAATLVTFDLPDDTYDEFVPRVERLVESDLTDAAVRHLHPEEVAVVVVGDARHADALRESGTVEIVEPEF
jgi:predicted Zn-dependent peptidase